MRAEYGDFTSAARETFFVEFPISLGQMLNRCFWLTFLFETVGSWWTLYCSLSSEKKPKLVLVSVMNPVPKLLDSPTGVGKALVFIALCVIPCSESVE